MGNDLREPDIKFGNLTVLVNGKADAEEWLDVIIRCTGRYGEGWVNGSIMQLGDLKVWCAAMERMNQTLSGRATFETTDPGLKLSMEIDKLGHIETEVEIYGYPSERAERHIFRFQADQSYLPAAIAQCKKVLKNALILFWVLLLGQPALAASWTRYPEPGKYDDSSILSFGYDSALDTVFGTTGGHCVFGDKGPVGIKHVDIGENFYLARGHTGTLISKDDPIVPLPDVKWSWWYSRVGGALFRHWKGDVAGHAQVILRVSPDHRIAILKEIAFVPGLNSEGRIDTSDETRKAFMDSVNACIASISTSEIPKFPLGAQDIAQHEDNSASERQDIREEWRRAQPYFEAEQRLENATWHRAQAYNEKGMTSEQADAQAAKDAQEGHWDHDKIAQLRADHEADVIAVERQVMQPFKSATFVATLSADRNIHAVIPNLTVLADIPSDEKSQWIARLCTILDAGYLYKESDNLRKQLPDHCQHDFIPRNAVHDLEERNSLPEDPGASGCPNRWRIVTQKTSDAVTAGLLYYIESRRFLEAQLFAASVVYDRDHFSLKVTEVNRIKADIEKYSQQGFFDGSNMKKRL
jgi:hypothetical protein